MQWYGDLEVKQVPRRLDFTCLFFPLCYYCYSYASIKLEKETYRPRSFAFLFVHSPFCLPTPARTPLYLFLICLPYVLGHRDQRFFFLFLSSVTKIEEINSLLFISLLHYVSCCSRRERARATTRTLMVPRCEEGTRRIYLMQENRLFFSLHI
jgi:hypothetical protein